MLFFPSGVNKVPCTQHDISTDGHQTSSTCHSHKTQPKDLRLPNIGTLFTDMALVAAWLQATTSQMLLPCSLRLSLLSHVNVQISQQPHSQLCRALFLTFRATLFALIDSITSFGTVRRGCPLGPLPLTSSNLHVNRHSADYLLTCTATDTT